jgi:hypothetical protein
MTIELFETEAGARCEDDAWQDLAAVIEGQGGQLTTTIRGLADKWNWHRSKVERFLDRHKAAGRIATRIEAGKTVISFPLKHQDELSLAGRETKAETTTQITETAETPALESAAMPVSEERPANPEPDEFDWGNSANEDVVIAAQHSIAVYWNAAGAITIRQERSWCDEYDPIVVVQPQHVQALVDRLIWLRGEIARHSKQR